MWLAQSRIFNMKLSPSYHHPCLHGVHHECGEGGIEVHLESKRLGAEPMEEAGVVVASTNVETVVTAGASTSTLQK